MRISIMSVTLLLVAGLVGTSDALGDIVHLKTGAKIEGQVVRQDSKEVVVKTKFGTQTFARADVVRIEKTASKKGEYQQKLKALEGTDAEGHYQLGLWCRAQKMRAEATKAFLKAVQIDNDHEGAHKALGHVKYDGLWMPPGKKKALEQQKLAQENLAKGMVRYRGKWVTKEEADALEKGLVRWEDKQTGKVRFVKPEDKAKLAKGLVNYNGRWYAKAEAEALEKGLFKVEGRYVDKQTANQHHSNWDNAWELESEHYMLVTNRDHDYATEVLDMAEKAFTAMREFFDDEPELYGDKLYLYMFKDQDEYNQFGSQNAGAEEGWRQKYFGGFYAADHPDSPAAVFSFYDETNRFDWTKYHLYHALAVQFVSEVQPNITSAWLRESIVSYFQRFAFFEWPDLKSDWCSHLKGNRFIPMDEFTELNALAETPDTGFCIDEQQSKRQVAQGGLLILFLTKTGPTEYHEKFKEFLKKMKRASSDADLFRRVIKVRKLEEDFKAWLNS